ncbi:zinc transporter ZntB [Pseudoalteromonas fenneropenaei]|uniref:Zinc transporter ZntB n=1 Tax=Pseudoalteromonas fenneropenaei TaxID=1737459 RepID=A0ABV7CLU3_9GAMM
MGTFSGLVHAIHLDGQGGYIAVEDLTAAIANATPQQPLWVHLDFSDQSSIHWLASLQLFTDWELEALLADETRPRLTKAQQGDFLFLRGVNLNPEQDPEDMVALRLFASERLMISCRRRSIKSVQDVFALLKQNQGPRSVSELVCEIAHCLTLRMQDIIYSLDDQLDVIENIVETCPPPYDTAALALIRRQAIALKRHIRPQRDAVNQLGLAKLTWLQESDKPKLVEVSNDLTRYIEELETSIEHATVIHQSIASQMSEQLNQRMYVMSVVAALFLPLGFLTGLLGVNIGGIPGTESPFAFGLFVLMLFVLTFAIGIYFRAKKWL